MIKSKGEKAFNIINVVIMLTLFAVFVFPYVIIVSASFSGERALAKYGPGLFIRDFSFASYRYIFSAGSTVARSLGVSVYILCLRRGSPCSSIPCWHIRFPVAAFSEKKR